VLATMVVSSALCLIMASRQPPRPPRAAEDLGTSAMPLGPFRLEERSGRPVTADDLADRVAIASFIFTRCPLSCPRISGIMRGLQRRLAGTNVLLVSVSVDPEHDTPAVLRSYAERYGASPDRWWFLTGPKSVIYDLIRDRFKLSVIEAPGPAASDTEAIVHSDRLALLDRGRIVGFFESSNPEALDALVLQARRRALPAWVTGLPSLNAGLNGLSACLLFAGWILIRRCGSRTGHREDDPPLVATDDGQVAVQPLVRGHIACMIAAVCTSALFLASYLYYHHRAGSVPFGQGGVLRVAYLSILLSHTLLATVSVPLILITLWRGWRGQFDRHVSVASMTLPIWLYVAVTGVVVYLLLYHLPAIQVGPSPHL
jgi:protein SCO1